jgi:serine/tyrosine/threonine adenylyltransferase
VIPRNHLVEEALVAATDAGDFGPLERLMVALAEPYDHTRDRAEYGVAPAPGGRLYRTFCGT